MLKRFLIILLFMLSLPAFAGEFEEAFNKGEPIFLYLHTNYCKYCKQFDPIYSKLSHAHKSKCHFISVDADTEYGRNFMRKFKAKFIPFVVMVDSNREYLLNIPPDCLLDYACADKEVKKFLSK